MRLIDADALKRRAQKLATESWKMKFTASVETVLNQFIDWIDEAQTVNASGKWNSVKDSLPAPNNDVIWCARYADNWDIRISKFTGSINHGIPHVEKYGPACIPLFWMPIPKEPPKEDENIL